MADKAEMEQRAASIIEDLQAVCKNHNCDLGVWLTWRDLAVNLDIMKQNPEMNEAQFGIQIRLNE